MASQSSWQVKIVSRVLILALASALGYAAPLGTSVNGAARTSEEALPDSPGARAQSRQNQSQEPQTSDQRQSPSGSTPSVDDARSETKQTVAQASPSNMVDRSPQQDHQPLGTAAAESIPTMGVAASRPAGAAIAPAKQHRVRTILIRVGAVVGVAAAVGATVALSEGSPSRPPGAR